jgi:hypothetical protein
MLKFWLHCAQLGRTKMRRTRMMGTRAVGTKIMGEIRRLRKYEDDENSFEGFGD